MLHEAGFLLDVELPDAKSAREGAVIIEGLASDFAPDRQDEAFEPGAFDRAIQTYLDTNPVLLYDHQSDKALGQVTDLKSTADGLQLRAEIDPPASGSWAEDVVEKVKSRTIRGLSVRGLFKRRMTPAGPRIYEADLAEISVTPFPVNPRTLFGVAQKSFAKADAEVVYDALAARVAKAEAMLAAFERACHNDL